MVIIQPYHNEDVKVLKVTAVALVCKQGLGT